MKNAIRSQVNSSFPRTRRRTPLRKVQSGSVIKASEVNRWVAAINELRKETA